LSHTHAGIFRNSRRLPTGVGPDFRPSWASIMRRGKAAAPSGGAAHLRRGLRTAPFPLTTGWEMAPRPHPPAPPLCHDCLQGGRLSEAMPASQSRLGKDRPLAPARRACRLTCSSPTRLNPFRTGMQVRKIDCHTTGGMANKTQRGEATDLNRSSIQRRNKASASHTDKGTARITPHRQGNYIGRRSFAAPSSPRIR